MDTTTQPVRVQRKSTKGWRMPDNTTHVGAGSSWANPFKVGEKYPCIENVGLSRIGVRFYLGEETVIEDREEAVRRFYDLLLPVINREVLPPYLTVEDVRAELAGKNLACWCPLDEPCHADVLLEIANQKEKDNQ